MTNPEPAPAPEKPLTVYEAKGLICKKLTDYFSKEAMHERLLRMAGGDVSRVAKNLAAFQTVIMSDEGGKDKNKFFYECTMSSLATCFLESMNMQLPFDSRNLVAMVIYQNGKDLEAELDISYKGFVNALKKHYPNSAVKVEYVYDGDIFKRYSENLRSTYTHEIKKSAPIDKDFTGVDLVYCYLSYTLENGETVSHVEVMHRTDILKIRSKARTKMVWDDFPSEMGKKAVIRRAAKIPFAAIDMDVDVEEIGNRHYQLDKPDTQSRIEMLKSAQQGAVDEQNKPTPAPAPAPEPKPSSAPEPAPAETGGQTVEAPSPEPAPPLAGDDAPPPIQNISDADFEEVPATKSPTPVETAKPVEKPEENSGKNEGLPPGEWDGKTLHLGAPNPTVKEFTSSANAAEYLKKVMASRRHAASRKKLIELNTPLVRALVKDGYGGVIGELHKLASEGLPGENDAQ